MKKSLLATVAAVALIAGAGIASAAEGPKDQPKAGHAEMKGGAAVKKSEPEMKRGEAIKPGKAETTGAGNETHVQGQDEPKPDSKDVKRDTGPRGEGKVKSNTSGENMDHNVAPAGKSAADEKAGAGMSKSSASEKSNSSAQGNTTAQSGKSASLTTEQKTKIRTSVLQSSSAPKVSRNSINFNISVGTVVPRSVHFVTVPQTIVEVYPEYRGFEYFVVDEEIIILDPHTLKIIAVLNV